MFDKFLQNLRQIIDRKLLKTAFFSSRLLNDLNWQKREIQLDSNKNEGEDINRYCLSPLQNDLLYQVYGLKNPKFMEETFSDNRVQKLWEKFRKLRKSCMHKRNINRAYNEKLHYNCLQQLLTLRLKTWILGNYGI